MDGFLLSPFQQETESETYTPKNAINLNTMSDKIKLIDPMDKLFKFWNWLDAAPPLFLNYNLRGDMITLYFPVDEMLSYVNMLHHKGYSDNADNIWVYKGYPKRGYYFRIGPHYVRIAQYKEKLNNQQDVLYIQQHYQDELTALKNKIKELQQIIDISERLLP